MIDRGDVSDGFATVAYSDGPDHPLLSPFEALAAAGVSARPRVLLGWMPTRPIWIDDQRVGGATVMAGSSTSSAVRDGRIHPLSVRMGAIPELLRKDPPTVAVISGVPRGAEFAFGSAVGWADELARIADRVVIEVRRDRPDLGGPVIGGNIVAAIHRSASRGVAETSAGVPRSPDAIDAQIAGRVVSIIPDGATLQLGLGTTADAIASRIRTPVRVWSGLVTESAADMSARGLVDGPVTTAYTWGADSVAKLHAEGMLDLRSTTVTHNLDRLASIPRLIACNGALQVGLDGAVNVERVGARTISGIGGHSDFCSGATRSDGGAAVIVVRATTSSGASSIVPGVDVVSTDPRDVGLVVTEHGVADLRGVDRDERAELLIAIADPDHRAALRTAAARHALGADRD